MFYSRLFHVIKEHFVRLFIGFVLIEIFRTTIELIALCYFSIYSVGMFNTNIRLFVYNILSVQAHNICNIFFGGEN